MVSGCRSCGMVTEMTVKKVRFSLQFKFFIILIITILFICSTLMVFFVTRSKNELYAEIKKRGMSEAKSLAYDSKYGVLTEDELILEYLVAGRMNKPDVVYVEILKEDGSILTKDIKEGYAFLHPDAGPVEYLGEDIYKTTLVSKGGDSIYEFIAPIMEERFKNPAEKKILEEAFFQSGEKAESLPSKRGSVKVGISLKDVHKKIVDFISISVLIIFLIITISVIASCRFVRLIIGPIKEVAKIAEEISRGDLTKTVDVKSSDEICVMADNFNRMTLSLKKTIYELEELKNELANKVDERTKDLQASLLQQKMLYNELKLVNEELSSFAYIVSHDLKAPLRAISSLSYWILTDYADKFDEKGKEQMDLLINRVKRMHNLIEGILDYSRVGRTQEASVPVDMNELLGEIIDMLGPSKNIDIVVEDKLPSIWCVQVRIKQVFQNLLSNAIKFIDKPDGKIKISAVREGDLWKFSVADNGPGIEERHFERIFKIFQTLSPRDQFENTGVGLAVVKKIVEIWGGKVWVESRVGIGSTFFFTVPIKTTPVTAVNY